MRVRWPGRWPTAPRLLAVIAGHDPDDPASADRPVPDYLGALGPDLRGMRIGVVRHFHETDIDTAPEVVAAFEAALDVLRSLGRGTIEDVRLRPAKQYSDVKITIAESELFNVHASRVARHGPATSARTSWAACSARC